MLADPLSLQYVRTMWYLEIMGLSPIVCTTDDSKVAAVAFYKTGSKVCAMRAARALITWYPQITGMRQLPTDVYCKTGDQLEYFRKMAADFAKPVWGFSKVLPNVAGPKVIDNGTRNLVYVWCKLNGWCGQLALLPPRDTTELQWKLEASYFLDAFEINTATSWIAAINKENSNDR